MEIIITDHDGKDTDEDKIHIDKVGNKVFIKTEFDHPKKPVDYIILGVRCGMKIEAKGY